MYAGTLWYEAQVKHWEGKIAEAKAVLKTYYENSVGIGEHSKLLEEFNVWQQQLTEAEDNLKSLKENWG